MRSCQNFQVARHPQPIYTACVRCRCATVAQRSFFFRNVPAESCFLRFLVGFLNSWIVIWVHNWLELIYMQVKIWAILFINARSGRSRWGGQGNTSDSYTRGTPWVWLYTIPTTGSLVPILLSHLGGSDLGIKARLPVRQPSRGLPEYLGVATDLTNPVAVSARDGDQPDLQSRAWSICLFKHQRSGTRAVPFLQCTFARPKVRLQQTHYAWQALDSYRDLHVHAINCFY